jgi:hypothetical protein
LKWLPPAGPLYPYLEQKGPQCDDKEQHCSQPLPPRPPQLIWLIESAAAAATIHSHVAKTRFLLQQRIQAVDVGVDLAQHLNAFLRSRKLWMIVALFQIQLMKFQVHVNGCVIPLLGQNGIRTLEVLQPIRMQSQKSMEYLERFGIHLGIIHCFQSHQPQRQ